MSLFKCPAQPPVSSVLTERYAMMFPLLHDKLRDGKPTDYSYLFLMLVHLSDFPSIQKVAFFSLAAQVQKWIRDKAQEARTQCFKVEHLSTKNLCDLAFHRMQVSSLHGSNVNTEDLLYLRGTIWPKENNEVHNRQTKKGIASIHYWRAKFKLKCELKTRICFKKGFTFVLIPTSLCMRRIGLEKSQLCSSGLRSTGRLAFNRK